MYRDIAIYIPSIGRANSLTTLASLSDEAKAVTSIVTKPEEVSRYKSCHQSGVEVKAQLDWHRHIGHVRKWLIETCPARYLCMLDDDLKFYYRPTPGDWHLKYLKDRSQFNEMMDFLMDRVRSEGVAHASISFREGSHACLPDWAYNVRYSRLFVYDTSQFNGVELGGMPVMEDFDIALQLIKMGKPSLVCYRYAQGQKSSGAAGGCSTYRDMALQREAALALERRHRPYVKAIEKETKTAWGGGVRTDAIVSWKKAYESYTRKPLEAMQGELSL